MTEINNNMHKYSVNLSKPEVKKEDTKKQQETGKLEKEVIRDTGVLGRSQIVGIKENDTQKSIDEAVSLAKKHPNVLMAGDTLFNIIYDDLIQKGVKPSEAYMLASSSLGEFTETVLPAAK